MKKHTTHHFGCECREEMFDDLVKVLQLASIALFTYEGDSHLLDLINLKIKEAKEMLQ